MIRLGAFKLVAPIGRGGMGEVWGGVHLESGAPVAIKVLNAKKASDHGFRRRFHNEVRAVAGLDHPNIVQVYDLGEVSAEAAGLSGGRLAAGALYLVMARVGGGTLSHRRGDLSWAELKAVLRSLLDALAHAHARNVIHRDIKPDNVLFGDGGERVQLTDFGLAHAVDREGFSLDTQAGAVGGTPAYMAPEQFHGDSRDVGPWSDLYALGCLVFAMVKGEPPFGRTPWLEVAAGHLYQPIPPLQPKIKVPDGFEDWVRNLLAKDVSDRYARAADAAWDLDTFDDPTEELLRPVPLSTAKLTAEEPPPAPRVETTAAHRLARSTEEIPRVTATQTTLFWDPQSMREALARRLSQAPAGGDRDTAPGPPPSTPPLPEPITEKTQASQEIPLRRPSPPPLPFTWRAPERPRTPGRLLGLGLYPLRTLPLVGRVQEREALWKGLQRTARLGRAQAMIVAGPAGAGKSRLAEWIAQRAHELGAAILLEAVHRPIPTRNDGLGPMILRYLRCAGLPRPDAEARVARRLETLGITQAQTLASVVELVLPSTEAERARGSRKVRFHGAVERHALVRRLLRAITSRRPVVLWIDDAHWGLDALQFVQHLLEVQEYAPLPVLVVLTVQDEAMSTRPAEAEALSRIADHPATTQVRVDPLPPPDHRALIRELLGLEPALAARVEARTAGNPQFAVRLVGDWVQRRLLVRSSDGYRLRDDAVIQLPDDLHAVWGATVAQLLEPLSPEDGVALELAAALGRDVVSSEWKAACALSGIQPSAGLLDLLLARRLASSADPELEWSFAHEMLRESLLRRARDHHRLQAHHGVCVQVVQQAEGAPSERLARHLVQAGRAADAVEPLLQVARGYVAAGEYRAARMVLIDRERWLEALTRAPTEDVARVAGHVLQAQVARKLGLTQEASSWCNRALGGARRLGAAALLCDALQEQAAQRLAGGDAVGAGASLRELLERVHLLGDPVRSAEATAAMGEVYWAQGDGSGAKAAFQRAVAQYGAAGEPAGAASAWLGLSEIAASQGELDQALKWARRAYQGYEATGSRWGQAKALHARGEVHRRAGRLEEAESRLTEALARFEALGLDEEGLRIDLGLIWAARGQYDEAIRLLRPDAAGPRAWALRGWCAAGARQWSDLDRALRALREAPALTERGVDLPWALEQAGELARRAGRFPRALDAWVQAAQGWEALDRPKDVARLREKLKHLPA